MRFGLKESIKTRKINVSLTLLVKFPKKISQVENKAYHLNKVSFIQRLFWKEKSLDVGIKLTMI